MNMNMNRNEMNMNGNDVFAEVLSPQENGTRKVLINKSQTNIGSANREYANWPFCRRSNDKIHFLSGFVICKTNLPTAHH
jgi:hypothetical protein